jgi:hypothetical protein
VGVLAFAAFSLVTVHAASIVSEDYSSLMKQASGGEFVRVMVTLEHLSLEQLGKNSAANKARLAQKARVLLSELGVNALSAGHWNNDAGQIGIYVNSNGLRMLTGSSNALSFQPDPTDKLRYKAYDADGSLTQIEQLIKTQGYADVQIVLQAEGEYDIARDERTLYRADAKLAQDIQSRLTQLKADLRADLTGAGNKAASPTPLKNLDERLAQGLGRLGDLAALQGNLKSLAGLAEQAKQSQIAAQPLVSARIDQETFIRLREHEGVRALRPVGFEVAQENQRSANHLETSWEKDVECQAELTP